MAELPMYRIVVFGAKIVQRPAPKGPKLIVDDDTKDIRLEAESVAESYAKSMAEKKFPAAGGWKTVISVTEMVVSEKPALSGEDDEIANLVNKYLDAEFPEIKSNLVWRNSLGFSDDKRPGVQIEVILAFMRKRPSIVMDRQPVLPKEREYFWKKIQIHVDAYLELDEAVAKSAEI